MSQTPMSASFGDSYPSSSPSLDNTRSPTAPIVSPKDWTNVAPPASSEILDLSAPQLVYYFLLNKAVCGPLTTMTKSVSTITIPGTKYLPVSFALTLPLPNALPRWLARSHPRPLIDINPGRTSSTNTFQLPFHENKRGGASSQPIDLNSILTAVPHAETPRSQRLLYVLHPESGYNYTNCRWDQKLICSTDVTVLAGELLGFLSHRLDEVEGSGGIDQDSRGVGRYGASS